MKSADAYKKLKQAVNIQYYIGPDAAKAIEAACCPPAASVKPKTVAKPPIGPKP